MVILVILWLWVTWLDHHHVRSAWVETASISIGHPSCQFELRSHPYRSAIFLSVWVHFEFSGSHLYRSTIFLSVWVKTAPILIDHLPISLSLSFSSWDCTYIDRPHFYHFLVYLCFWDRTYIDRSFSHVSSSRGRTYIDRSCSYHFSC